MLILGFMILASVGIGWVADRTRSVLAAAALHIFGNIMGLTADFQRLIPALQTRAFISLACVAVFVILLRVWRIRILRAEQRDLHPGGHEQRRDTNAAVV